MRIISATFPSSEDFLANFSSAHDGGAIFYRTRMDLRNGPSGREALLVEVSFPGLPNRATLRAEVAGFDAHGQGAWLQFSREAAATRDFVLDVARGEARRGVPRNHQRFPMELACDWQIPGSRDRVLSTTEDLGAGGVFVRTLTPPPIGTEVSLTVGPVGDGPITLRGQVSWVRGCEAPAQATERTTERTSGMGVKFADCGDMPTRRLRELLRHVSERGRVVLSVSA